MVAVRHLHQHVGEREPQEKERQQKPRRERPPPEHPDNARDAREIDAVVKHIAQDHADLHKALRPCEAVGVAAELVRPQKGEELLGKEGLEIKAGREPRFDVGDHALLRLVRGQTLLEIGGEQVHVRVGIAPAGLPVEADIDVVPGHRRDLLVKHALHMPVPERERGAKKPQHRREGDEPREPAPGVFRLPPPQEEEPEGDRDEQNRRDGPHDLDRREEKPERRHPAGGPERPPAHPSFQAQKEPEKQQDQEGVDGLREDEGAQHQLAGGDRPEKRREIRRPPGQKLPPQKPHKAAAQGGEQGVERRDDRELRPEEADRQAQNRCGAEDVGVHGHIPGGGDRPPVREGAGHVPVFGVVAEGLDAHKRDPEPVQNKAEQHGAQGGMGRRVERAPAQKHIKPETPESPQHEGREIGPGRQPLAQDEPQRHEQHREEYAQHDSFQKYGGFFHGKLRFRIFYSGRLPFFGRGCFFPSGVWM